MKTETTVSHTPAPWVSHFNSDFEVHRIYAVTGNASTKPVAELYSGATSEANARLIAAAPEMLEALQQASFAIPTDHAAFETVRAAIKKALETK